MEFLPESFLLQIELLELKQHPQLSSWILADQRISKSSDVTESKSLRISAENLKTHSKQSEWKRLSETVQRRYANNSNIVVRLNIRKSSARAGRQRCAHRKGNSRTSSTGKLNFAGRNKRRKVRAARATANRLIKIRAMKFHRARSRRDLCTRSEARVLIIGFHAAESLVSYPRFLFIDRTIRCTPVHINCS